MLNCVKHQISTRASKCAHAATRNMACCAVIGQGAGVAAALSVRQGRDLDNVDIGDIQAELERQGARVW